MVLAGYREQSSVLAVLGASRDGRLGHILRGRLGGGGPDEGRGLL